MAGSEGISIFNFAQNFGSGTYDYFLTFAAIGFVISLVFNIIRYMLTFLMADEQARQKTKASIITSVATGFFVFLLVVLLGFIEEQIPKMFGLDGYGAFLNSIPEEINSANDKLNEIRDAYVKRLESSYNKFSSQTSVFGVTVSTAGCDFGINTALDVETCMGNIQREIAEQTVVISTAFNTQISLIVGNTLFDFFTTRAAAFLLGAGLAYYAFDPSRSAGAAMISLALAAFYVYPVAYKAFMDLPKPPDLGGATANVIDIASAQFCNINTFPSTYITKSDATLSITLAQSGKTPNPTISIETGSVISFINSLYLSFLMKHAAALAVSMIFIQNSYVVLSSGFIAAPLLRRIGGFL
ncbi:MAG: hypothetical protein QXI89_00345 [Candidatus Anstonellales archaeon]